MTCLPALFIHRTICFPDFSFFWFWLYKHECNAHSAHGQNTNETQPFIPYDTLCPSPVINQTKRSRNRIDGLQRSSGEHSDKSIHKGDDNTSKKASALFAGHNNDREHYQVEKETQQCHLCESGQCGNERKSIVSHHKICNDCKNKAHSP